MPFVIIEEIASEGLVIPPVVMEKVPLV